jgi:hypothetical protein
MKRAIVAVTACWAIAGVLFGATPPAQNKAVTPQKKSSPVVVGKTTPQVQKPPVRPPATASKTATTTKPATTSTAARTPAKTPARQTTTRRYYARRYYSPVQSAPTADRYREIQDALAAKGYLSSPSNGVWDKASMDAMQHFQQDQKLDATGKLTARSLVALGLGPKTPATTVTGEATPAQ